MFEAPNAPHRGQLGGGPGPILIALIASYRDLGGETASRLHAASGQLTGRLCSGPAVAAAVVLSTCNRFEIYCEVPAGMATDEAFTDSIDAVGDCTGLAVPALGPLFERVEGQSATHHLFSVAAGLDSVVVGEREVAGQVRRALAAAQAAGTANGRMVRLFEAASRTGKQVGARTPLGRAGRSVATVALDLAAGGPGPGTYSGRSAVLFGTGSYASCVAALLVGRGCTEISVFSHSGRAEAFAAARGAKALTARDLPGAVARADLVVGCSGTEARVGVDELHAWRRQSAGTLVLLDLAPSHDFDPRAAELPWVRLIDLATVRRAAPPADAQALQLARALTMQEARAFEAQEATRVLDAAIVALRRHLTEVLETELESLARGDGAGTPNAEVAAALRHLIRRVLHAPTIRARELAAQGRPDAYLAALEALFGLQVAANGPLRPPGAGVVR